MDNGRLKFTATIDDSDFNKKLNSMQNGVDAIDKNFQSNALKNAQLTKEQQRAFEAYSNVLKGAKEGLKNATDPTQIGVYKKQIEQTTESLRKLIETASKQTKLPKEDFRITPYNSSGNSIGQMKESLRGFKERLIDEKDINNSKQLNKNIQQLEGDIKRATNVGKKGFDELGNAIPTKQTNSFISILKNFAGVFGIVAGVGLVTKGIKDTIRTIIDFDKSMVNMSAIAGKSRADLNGLELEIRRVASTSLNTANAVADMATELIKLGSTPDGVKALLKPVNDLSIATGLSAEKSAVLLKSTLNAFQETENQATKYADVIAKALNLTALDATKFGEAFTYIGATSKAAGVSVEKTSALVGVLVDNGVKASSAGRILSSVFGRLAKDGKDFDTELEKVRTSTNQLGQASKSFGAEGGRLGVVLANNKDRVKELTSQLENSSGSLDKLTQAQLSSVGARFNMLTSAWTEFVLAVDSGNGIISGTLKAIADLGSMFISAITPAETLTKAMYQQQVSLNLLIGRITASNVKESERLKLINDLKNSYPEFISLIKDEDFSNGNLINTLKGVNLQYEKRILLQKQVEAENKIFTDLEKSIGNAASRTTFLFKQLDEIKRRRKLDIEIDINNIDESAKKIQEAIRKNTVGSDSQSSRDIYDIKRTRIALKEQNDEVKKINEEYKNQKDLTSTIQKNLGISTEEERQRGVEAKNYADQVQSALKTAESFGGKSGKDFDVFNLESINAYISSKTQVNELETKTKDLTSQRLSLVDKINKIERDLNISTLSEREGALQRIIDKYVELRKEASKLGVSQKKLNELEAQETILVNYKLDTDDLVKNLQEQQKYYEEFESAKSKIGIEQSKETYKDLIDISKSYYDALSDAQDSIDFDNMTAKERNRYAVLTKLLVDYGTEQSKQERERLVSLYENTITTEEKISRVRLKYSKLFASAQANFEGSELDARTSILEKQFKDELKGLSNEIVSQANDYSNVANLVAGATRNQIESQIQSLTNYLKTAEGLTEAQRASIQKMIENLTIALPTALGSSGEGATSAIQREFTQIDSEILKLNNSINALREKGGKNVDLFASEIANLEAQLKGLEARKLDLQLDNLIASGKDIEDLGNKFIELSNTIILSDSVLGGFLKSLGNLAGQTGSVINALGGIGKAFNNIKKQGGLGDIFSSGSKDGGFLGGLGSLAGAFSPIASGATALLNIVSSISKKQKEEYKKFKEFQAGIIQGEKDYQELLRQRSFDNAAKGKPLAEGIQAQIDELNKQAPELEKEYADLLSKIQENGEAVANKYRRKRNGFSKTVTIFEDLKNADYDQLEKLFLQGKLEGDTLKWFEALKKSKEELDKLGLTLDDLKLKLDELVTGTNVSQLSNLFADLFASGTNSAVEFGNKLEDVIKNAILSGFKARFIEKEAQALFDDIAGLINKETPISQDDIDKLIADATKKFDYLNGVFASLTSGLNLNFGGGDLGGSAKDGIKRITETQADRLTGILTGVQQDVIASRLILFESKNFLSSSLNELIAIQVNTKRTADNTESMDYKMTQIVNALQNNQQQALGML